MKKSSSFIGPLPLTSTLIPIGIYARVSTDHQVGFRFDSCEHQVLVCRDYIGKMAHCGWYEAGAFVDEAYSGANMERPGIRALMAQIAAGRIKVVLIYKLERILRSTYEWAKFSKFLEKHGCRLLTPDDDHSDFSAAGRFKTNMLVSMSEYERGNIAEKTLSKMLAQAKRGMWCGGYVPFGYDYDRVRQQLRPHPEEASLACRIFQRAAELVSLGEIADELNAAGHRTGQRWIKDAERNHRSIGEKPFRSDVLRKMIQSPLYRGVIRFRGEEFPGQHEALVTSEVWEQANAAITEAKKKRTPRLRPQDKYANLLKGLVICARCSVPLFSRASGKDRDAGKHYRYYVCVNKTAPEDHDPCGLGNIAAEPLEKAVIGFLSQPALGGIASEWLTGESIDDALRKKLTAEFLALDEELKKMQGHTQNCLDVLAEQGLRAVKPELTDRINDLQVRKQPILVLREEYRQQLAALDGGAFERARVAHAFDRLRRLLPNLERERQRELLFAILGSIQVHQVKRSRDGSDDGNERILKLCFRIRLSDFVEVMECNVGLDDFPVRKTISSRRSMTIDAQIALGRKGRTRIVAPFQAEIGEPQNVAPEIVENAKHPIHRAMAWEAELERGQSVRSLARKENVSPSLVSFHLKLLRLAPEIKVFAQGLSTAPEVDFFSLRKLAILSESDQERQHIRFREMKRQFSAKNTQNVDEAGRRLRN